MDERAARHEVTVDRDGGDDAGPSDRFFNRELSWIDFNGRVLALASDPRVPLLERVKFLAIFPATLPSFTRPPSRGLCWE